MDSRRAETLEALSAYLQHQRTLLARTQADIERLKKLKEKALTSPEQYVNRSSIQLLRSEENISDIQDYQPAQSFPANIDWDVFSSSDATPLRTLAIRTRIDHTQRTVPSNVQQTPLSFLQKFVKDARKVILDPVLESLSPATDTSALPNPIVMSNAHMSTSSSSDHDHVPTLTLPYSLSEDENEEHPQTPTTSRKHERPRTKNRELRKRKNKTNLVVEGKLEEKVPRVRHDSENENTEMDVLMGTPQSCLSIPLDGLSDQVDVAMNVDNASVPTFGDVTQCTKLPKNHRAVLRQNGIRRPSRTRKPSLKLQSQTLTALARPRNEPAPSPLSPMPDSFGKPCGDVAEINDASRKLKVEPLSASEVNTPTDKIRSDTYKQAWSVSEQHLLERLLEEIPDGERNRWAKISQAMGGRRTPRQVASRVQKYFEKLKRFGVGVDSKAKASKG